MQRFCAEYVVSVKVSDVMITSDETQEEVIDKIKKLGVDKLREWVVGDMIDPEGMIITENIRITDKGL